jgi:DNA (cytosine-5)-methyltransferase 1
VTAIDGIDYRARDFRQGDQPAFGLTSKSQYWTHRAGTTARRVTVEEAGVLQGFPDDFPWQGSKTSQFRQVGNAVNPAVAEVVLRSVL